MVFYRKYRSQRIADLDLESVRKKMTSLLQSREIPHALLFTGPKGLGKTSSARILAKAVNCERNRELKKNSDKSSDKKKSDDSKSITKFFGIEPCNECQACISITNGSNLDVIEIDAASNRGIDEIRTLRERIKFAPSHLSKKVYIIDEVHMLTNEAFNALLKTLEEPPNHVIFILCTTEAERLPATITSRLFQIHFEKPTLQEIIHSLNRVVEGEKLMLDEEVYGEIAKLANGAFRDAHKILEELSLAMPDKHITSEIFQQTFKNWTTDAQIVRLLSEIQTKNSTEALKTIEELAARGVDFKIFTQRVVELLRLEMMRKLQREEMLLTFSLSELKELVEKFNNAYKEIALSVLPQIPLELAVIELTMTEDVKMVEKKVIGEDKGIASDSVPTERKIKPHLRQNQPVTSDSHTTASTDTKDLLYQVIDGIKKDNFTVAGILRSCKILDLNGSTMSIVAPFKFHKEKLEDVKTLRSIEAISSKILQREIKVEIRIAN